MAGCARWWAFASIRRTNSTVQTWPFTVLARCRKGTKEPEFEGFLTKVKRPGNHCLQCQMRTISIKGMKTLALAALLSLSLGAFAQAGSGDIAITIKDHK